MYSILIVDDEKAIVEGLNMIISRAMDNCKVVGMAYDSDQGYELGMELNPDIVVTDIRMLKGDGLDMIERLKRKGNKSQFIILSGYASFAYAKRGMSLGARFYLNKPVEEEELFDSLRQAIEDIEEERTRISAMENMKKDYASAIEDIKDVILRDVLDSEPNDAWLTVDRLEAVGFPVSGTHYSCGIIEFYDEIQPQFTELLAAAHTWLRDWNESESDLRVVQYSHNQFAVVIYGRKRMESRLLLQDFQRIQRELFQHTGLCTSIGLGQIYEDFHGITKSFAEAREALHYRIIKGMHTIIPYQDVQVRHSPIVQIEEENLTKLEACLDSLDIEGAKIIVHAIFKSLSHNGELSLSHLQYQCMSILFCGMRKLTPSQLRTGDWLNENLLSIHRLSQFRTLGELRDWIVHALRELVSLRAIGSSQSKKDVIADIKCYISENFDQNISLADLSNRFYLNPYYLSQLFKEKTGDTYLNYVIRLRIRKSKELLENTDLKIYEVCERVGYSDTNYFSKLFEKIVGCRPSEYKKRSTGKKVT